MPETAFQFKRHTPERCIGSVHFGAILCALCSSLHKVLLMGENCINADTTSQPASETKS